MKVFDCIETHEKYIKITIIWRERKGIQYKEINKEVILANSKKKKKSNNNVN